MVLDQPAEAKKPPVFDVPLKPLTVDEGEKMSLRCHVCGSAPLTIQWMKDRKELTSGGNTRISFSDGTACLEISPASIKDAGDYLCKATNDAGSEFCKAKVAVRRKNKHLNSAFNQTHLWVCSENDFLILGDTLKYLRLGRLLIMIMLIYDIGGNMSE